MPMNYNLKTLSSGYPEFFYFDKDKGLILPLGIVARNKTVYSGADILSNLARGKTEYALRLVYFEFRNLANPDDPANPPTPDRGGASAYYSGLAGSPDRDFIRVLSTSYSEATSTDSTKYSGNRFSISAQTSGGTGRWGKTFASNSNSAVYGVAVGAAPDPNDPTKDVIYARSYITSNNQPFKIAKVTGLEVGFSWPLEWT